CTSSGWSSCSVSCSGWHASTSSASLRANRSYNRGGQVRSGEPVIAQASCWESPEGTLMTLLAPRRLTRPVYVGDVRIGGGAPIVVQSMTTTDTRDPKATLRQIHELADAGCEIVRVAVPDRVAAAALPDIVPHSPVPLIADIHFEHTLALSALDAGIHGLRLNPGNIRKPEDVREVVRKAKEREVPIRIGVNFSSVPPMSKEFVDEMAEQGANQIELIAEHMVRTAEGHIKILEDLDFDNIKISLKAFEVPVLIEAYKRMAPRNMYPFHIGVTEAGTPRDRKSTRLNSSHVKISYAVFCLKKKNKHQTRRHT